MPFLSSSSSSVPPGKMQAMCATGARLWPTLASFEHPSQETSGSSNVPGRRNCAQTTQGCSACSRCERRRLGGMAADWQPRYRFDALAACCSLCLAVKVPRLTGVSGLEIWIVETPSHRSNVSEGHRCERSLILAAGHCAPLPALTAGRVWRNRGVFGRREAFLRGKTGSGCCHPSVLARASLVGVDTV